MSKTNLILGTVQIGMNYGIANATGKPDIKTAREILQAAWDGGIQEFDTAIGYGESEKILGVILHEMGVSSLAQINTKPHGSWNGQDFSEVKKDLEASLKKLHVEQLNTLLFHNEAILESWTPKISDAVNALRDEGKIRNVGVSVYSADAAMRALSNPAIDVVQIPANLLDRRFEKAGILHKAQSLGKALQIRSIFLQGLLFMAPHQLPAHMAFAKRDLADLHHILCESNLTLTAAAIGFVQAEWPGCKILIGAETQKQVLDNLDVATIQISPEIIARIKKQFPDVSEQILNPSLWGK